MTAAFWLRLFVFAKEWVPSFTLHLGIRLDGLIRRCEALVFVVLGFLDLILVFVELLFQFVDLSGAFEVTLTVVFDQSV